MLGWRHGNCAGWRRIGMQPLLPGLLIPWLVLQAVAGGMVRPHQRGCFRLGQVCSSPQHTNMGACYALRASSLLLGLISVESSLMQVVDLLCISDAEAACTMCTHAAMRPQFHPMGPMQVVDLLCISDSEPFPAVVVAISLPRTPSQPHC